VGRNGEKIGYMCVGNRPEHRVLKCVDFSDGFLGTIRIFFRFCGVAYSVSGVLKSVCLANHRLHRFSREDTTLDPA